MKLTVKRADLVAALGIVSRTVADRTAIPSLTHVRFTAEDDALVVTSTNLSTSTTIAVDAVIDTPGQALVSPKVLMDWLTSMNGVDVHLDVDTARFRTTVQVDRNRTVLNGLDPEDFARIPEYVDDCRIVSVNAQILRRMIATTAIAVATNESRPILAGLCLTFRGTGFRMSAADGFRLAQFDHTLKKALPEDRTIVVPGKSISILAGLIEDADKTVDIAMDPNTHVVIARVGRRQWVSALIDGTFPDTDMIFRQQPAETTIKVDRRALLGAVRASRTISAANNDVMRLDVQDGALTISSNAETYGTSEIVVDAEVSFADDFVPAARAVNHKFLSDVLAVLNLEHVELAFGATNRHPYHISDPGVVGYRYLITPMVMGGA